MLAGGKVYTALVGVLYLALATRSLGAHDFGVLILIHAVVSAMRDLTALRTEQCVVKYGAACLENDERANFQKLVKFTALVDASFCFAGMLLGMLVIHLAGARFGITAELAPLATLYCCAILFNVKATPLGLLRLFNRFDLIALTVMVVPSVRLLGAIVAFAFYQNIVAFLCVWFASGACHCLATVWVGWREFRRRGHSEGMDWRLAGLTRPHERLWRFLWAANVHLKLHSANRHVSVLGAGFFLGPAAAGLFKVAVEAADVLIKPAQLFTETLYPELVKIAAAGQNRSLWRVITRAALVAGGVAALVWLGVFVLGKTMLSLFFGAEFTASYPALMLLLTAGAVAMTAFALDPAMYAIGRPGVSMNVRIVTSLLHVSVILLLAERLGLPGIGIAHIASSFATAFLLWYCARHLIKNAPPGPQTAPVAQP